MFKTFFNQTPVMSYFLNNSRLINVFSKNICIENVYQKLFEHYNVKKTFGNN